MSPRRGHCCQVGDRWYVKGKNALAAGHTPGKFALRLNFPGLSPELVYPCPDQGPALRASCSPGPRCAQLRPARVP